MKWFIDSDWSWNGVRQPYRVKERYPESMLIDGHLSVCEFHIEFHNESLYK